MNNNSNKKQLTRFQRFKKWLFRPVNAKVKTYGIICSIVATYVFSIVLSMFTHWLLALIPLFLLVLCLYCAKLPVKVVKPDIEALRGLFNDKKK